MYLIPNVTKKFVTHGFTFTRVAFGRVTDSENKIDID